MRILKTDVLVIGAGGAGMYASIAAANADANVILCDKSLISRGGATVMAQMTVAAAIGHEEADHWTHHLVDTIKSGQGLCNEELSYLLCRQAGDRILEMKKWKTDWANKNGRIIQVMAPGHQVKRCCYVDFLNTGPAVSRTLRGEVVKRPRVKRLSGLLILDLCVDFGRVLGAIALNVETGEFLAIDSKSVVLAAGGLTHLYNRNSASKNMFGDSHALALRAGAALIDMEFVQFFPIGHLAPRLVGMDPIMWDPFRYKLGGKLLNGNGQQFIENYGGVDGEQYTVGRDLASYAIIHEVRAGRGSPNGGVWLSFKHLSPTNLRGAFGPIIDKLKNNGIDLTKQPIEVAPIAHYHMGGIEVDTNLETKIRGLFAAGECVGGANGANRLSGNAIPEAFVFGNIAGRNAAECPAKLGHLTATDAESLLHKSCSILEKNTDDRENKRLSIKATLKELKNVMWSNVGVLRTEEKLLRAMKTIKDIRENVFPHLRPEIGTVFNTSLMDWSDLRNSLICCEAICLAALGRRESRGAHQREDIPNTSEEFIKNQVIALNNNQLSVEWKNVKRKHFDLDRKRLAKI